MSRTRAYRCLNCLEHTIDREFDTSHLSVTCPNCGSFERFVNEAVFQQFEAFEASPPPEFDWNRLDRTEKLVVAERLVRSTKTLDDFRVVGGESTEGEDEPVETGGEAVEADDESAETGGEAVEADDEPIEAVADDRELPEGDDEPVDGDASGEESTNGVVAKGTDGETA
ncbi:hypothetical protein [Halorubrum sp.]|uniref:hypothetical protein n=1 Tax=Halorubrum sp. TaxID=1879286 RepID=UPI0039706529